MSITLSKAEITVLQTAAEAGGMLQLAETMKPITRQRMLGHFEAEGLIAVSEPDGIEPHLTPAGYRAVGLRAPRPTKKNAALPPDRPIDAAGPAHVADARETGPRGGRKPRRTDDRDRLAAAHDPSGPLLYPLAEGI